MTYVEMMLKVASNVFLVMGKNPQAVKQMGFAEYTLKYARMDAALLLSFCELEQDDIKVPAKAMFTSIPAGKISPRLRTIMKSRAE